MITMIYNGRYIINKDIIRVLAQRVKEYRFAARMSQKELLEKSGLGLAIINHSQHKWCTDFNGLFIISRGILDKFLFDGGYCTFKDGQASFHYYLTDHLGNNRAVVSEAGTVEQTTEYYPFGGIYGDVSTNSGLQPYKYNGKEFDHYLGLDLYDYGARLYDPALVVWTGVDPLADECGGISPYVYCGDNPISYVDNNGMKYDQNNKKISNLGGNEFDFYHLENHNTKVVNRKSGMVNIIKGGERLIRNYTHRTNDTTISQLTSEFLNETGPEKSL